MSRHHFRMECRTPVDFFDECLFFGFVRISSFSSLTCVSIDGISLKECPIRISTLSKQDWELHLIPVTNKWHLWTFSPLLLLHWVIHISFSLKGPPRISHPSLSFIWLDWAKERRTYQVLTPSSGSGHWWHSCKKNWDREWLCSRGVGINRFLYFHLPNSFLIPYFYWKKKKKHPAEEGSWEVGSKFWLQTSLMPFSDGLLKYWNSPLSFFFFLGSNLEFTENQKFVISLCSLGEPDYVNEIVNMLDPDGTLIQGEKHSCRKAYSYIVFVFFSIVIIAIL